MGRIRPEVGGIRNPETGLAGGGQGSTFRVVYQSKGTCLVGPYMDADK